MIKLHLNQQRVKNKNTLVNYSITHKNNQVLLYFIWTTIKNKCICSPFQHLTPNLSGLIDRSTIPLFTTISEIDLSIWHKLGINLDRRGLFLNLAPIAIDLSTNIHSILMWKSRKGWITHLLVIGFLLLFAIIWANQSSSIMALWVFIGRADKTTFLSSMQNPKRNINTDWKNLIHNFQSSPTSLPWPTALINLFLQSMAIWAWTPAINSTSNHLN